MIVVAATGGRAIAFGFIPLILVFGLFGAYLAISPVSNTSNDVIQPICQQFSCVQIQINSNSPITGIDISLVPEPAQCFNGSIPCDASGPQCNLPSNFCSSVNTQSSSDTLTFQAVGQGYYWLEFNAHAGGNATRGTYMSIHVENQAIAYITANITASLATIKIGVTYTTSG